MRTTPALRGLAAALLTGGTLLAAAAGTTAAAAPVPAASVPAAPAPAYPDGPAVRGDDAIWGTVTSPTPLAVREAPTSHAPAVARLAPGTEDRVLCAVRGQSVNGNPYWYWLDGAQGWASAAFVDSGGRWVPRCADVCPQWKNP